MSVSAKHVCESVCVCVWSLYVYYAEQIELPAKLLDYFLRSNKSDINQWVGLHQLVRLWQVQFAAVSMCVFVFVCACVCVCVRVCVRVQNRQRVLVPAMKAVPCIEARLAHAITLQHIATHWFMIAFITWNSNLVPLLEGLCTSNPYRFEFSGFEVFAGNTLPRTSCHKSQVLEICPV